MKTFLYKGILFISIPIFSLEVLFRTDPWLEQKCEERINPYFHVDDKKSVKYIFIGTSRVAAAVLEESMADEDPGSYYVNAGRGYTTAAVQFLGLKYLIEKKHAVMKGAKILVESPAGCCMYPCGWDNSEWVNKDGQQLIIPYLEFSDLVNFWKYSSNDIFVKVNVSLLYFFRSYRYTCVIKTVISRNSFQDICAKSGIIKGDTAVSVLAGKGGIKKDSVSIRKNRLLAVEYYSEYKGTINEIKAEDYPKSIFEEMYELLNEHEASLVVFSIPLTSVQLSAYKSETASKNAAKFKTYLKSRKIPYLDVNFSTNDSDFPDLWHLSGLKAVDFTRILKDRLENQRSSETSLSSFQD